MLLPLFLCALLAAGSFASSEIEKLFFEANEIASKGRVHRSAPSFIRKYRHDPKLLSFFPQFLAVDPNAIYGYSAQDNHLFVQLVQQYYGQHCAKSDPALVLALFYYIDWRLTCALTFDVLASQGPMTAIIKDLVRLRSLVRRNAPLPVKNALADNAVFRARLPHHFRSNPEAGHTGAKEDLHITAVMCESPHKNYLRPACQRLLSLLLMASSGLVSPYSSVYAMEHFVRHHQLTEGSDDFSSYIAIMGHWLFSAASGGTDREPILTYLVASHNDTLKNAATWFSSVLLIRWRIEGLAYPTDLAKSFINDGSVPLCMRLEFMANLAFPLDTGAWWRHESGRVLYFFVRRLDIKQIEKSENAKLFLETISSGLLCSFLHGFGFLQHRHTEKFGPSPDLEGLQLFQRAVSDPSPIYRKLWETMQSKLGHENPLAELMASFEAFRLSVDEIYWRHYLQLLAVREETWCNSRLALPSGTTVVSSITFNVQRPPMPSGSAEDDIWDIRHKMYLPPESKLSSNILLAAYIYYGCLPSYILLLKHAYNLEPIARATSHEEALCHARSFLETSYPLEKYFQAPLVQSSSLEALQDQLHMLLRSVSIIIRTRLLRANTSTAGEYSDKDELPLIVFLVPPELALVIPLLSEKKYRAAWHELEYFCIENGGEIDFDDHDLPFFVVLDASHVLINQRAVMCTVSTLADLWTKFLPSPEQLHYWIYESRYSQVLLDILACSLPKLPASVDNYTLRGEILYRLYELAADVYLSLAHLQQVANTKNQLVEALRLSAPREQPKIDAKALSCFVDAYPELPPPQSLRLLSNGSPAILGELTIAVFFKKWRTWRRPDFLAIRRLHVWLRKVQDSRLKTLFSPKSSFRFTHLHFPHEVFPNNANMCVRGDCGIVLTDFLGRDFECSLIEMGRILLGLRYEQKLVLLIKSVDSKHVSYFQAKVSLFYALLEGMLHKVPLSKKLLGSQLLSIAYGQALSFSNQFLIAPFLDCILRNFDIVQEFEQIEPSRSLTYQIDCIRLFADVARSICGIKQGFDVGDQASKKYKGLVSLFSEGVAGVLEMLVSLAGCPEDPPRNTALVYLLLPLAAYSPEGYLLVERISRFLKSIEPSRTRAAALAKFHAHFLDLFLQHLRGPAVAGYLGLADPILCRLNYDVAHCFAQNPSDSVRLNSEQMELVMTLMAQPPIAVLVCTYNKRMNAISKLVCDDQTFIDKAQLYL